MDGDSFWPNEFIPPKSDLALGISAFQQSIQGATKPYTIVGPKYLISGMQQKKHASTSTICRLLIAWIEPVHFDHALKKKHTRYLQVPGLTGQFWVLLELRKSKIPSLRHCNAVDFQASLYIRNIFMVLLITHNIFLGVGVCQDTMDTIRQSSWDYIL